MEFTWGCVHYNRSSRAGRPWYGAELIFDILPTSDTLTPAVDLGAFLDTVSLPNGTGVRNLCLLSRVGGRRLGGVVLVLACLFAGATAVAQTRPASRPGVAVPPELAGRTVEEVRILGRNRPLSVATKSEIAHQIRTHEGEKFDPATVEEDYQRIYQLRKFSNVEARVEPTAGGVIVIFEVAEQNLIRSIRFVGNKEFEDAKLSDTIDLQLGQAIDPFRLGQAREAMERFYRSRNYTYAHIEIPQDELAKGDVVFKIIEGPKVYVRRVQILGNHSYPDDKLKDEIKTKSWFPIFVQGLYDPDQVESDVAAIRQFYEQRGFFDVKVGRKIVVNADQTEVMVTFLVDEGSRYVVGRISFKGNISVPEKDLREGLKQSPGRPYNADTVRRDIRLMVKAYSAQGGFLFVPGSNNPDYLHIEPRQVFHNDSAVVDLVYEINEGKRFAVSRILVKGNNKTYDKVILRELRDVEPGKPYNSAALQEAHDRLMSTRLFTAVNLTPIGEDPDRRDLLIEVNEADTGRVMLSAGVSSNLGLLGQISYENPNFDIANWPKSWSDVTSGRAWTGAGQYFRILLEPGTEVTRARIDWGEPWFLDQPYSLFTSFYISSWQRENWLEDRGGARISVGKRFNDVWSAQVTLRGEDVRIYDIEDHPSRAPEILALNGHSTVTSAGIDVRRNTTDSPLLPSTGTNTRIAWEHAGAMGGDFDFDKFTASWTLYQTLYEDLLDRKTILSYHVETGYITPDAPFFERFYGGGTGSIRGFKYRGVSPRSGSDDDPVGGDFMLTGGLEVSYPIVGDNLRGVVFTDVGTIERDVRLGTIRTSVGVGIRWTIPFFGQVPLALDLAFPVTKDRQDDTRIFSITLGLAP